MEDERNTLWCHTCKKDFRARIADGFDFKCPCGSEFIEELTDHNDPRLFAQAQARLGQGELPQPQESARPALRRPPRDLPQLPEITGFRSFFFGIDSLLGGLQQLRMVGPG